MTTEKDIVLIYLEDSPIAFARIEDISADSKPGWYHVRMLILRLPLETVTWILREEYIDGAPFTMDDRNMRLELIQEPKEEENTPPSEQSDESNDLKKPLKEKKGAEVISLLDRQKEKS